MRNFYSRLAENAERSKPGALFMSILCAVVALTIPVMLSLLRQRPCDMYSRILNADFDSLPQAHISDYLTISDDGGGFIKTPAALVKRQTLENGDVKVIFSETPPAAADGGIVLAFSPEAVVFLHGSTALAAPLNTIPLWAADECDYLEIFDRLALQNGYYGRVYLPVALVVSLACVLMVASLAVMAAGLLGMGRKLTHALPMGKRLRVFAACSWPPALVSLLAGLVVPVFHLLLFEIMLIYLAYKTQKLL